MFNLKGPWIPIQEDLHQRREVILIARRTGLNADEVVGKLVRFWSWMARETDDGCLKSCAKSDACVALALRESFMDALDEVGWVKEDPEDGLSVPNADRWLTKKARSRLLAALRQKAYRARQTESDAPRDAGVALETSRERNATVTKSESEVSLHDTVTLSVSDSGERNTKYPLVDPSGDAPAPHTVTDTPRVFKGEEDQQPPEVSVDAVRERCQEINRIVPIIQDADRTLIVKIGFLAETGQVAQVWIDEVLERTRTKPRDQRPAYFTGALTGRCEDEGVNLKQLLRTCKPPAIPRNGD